MSCRIIAACVSMGLGSIGGGNCSDGAVGLSTKLSHLWLLSVVQSVKTVSKKIVSKTYITKLITLQNYSIRE